MVPGQTKQQLTATSVILQAVLGRVLQICAWVKVQLHTHKKHQVNKLQLLKIQVTFHFIIFWDVLQLCK